MIFGFYDKHPLGQGNQADDNSPMFYCWFNNLLTTCSNTDAHIHKSLSHYNHVNVQGIYPQANLSHHVFHQMMPLYMPATLQTSRRQCITWFSLAANGPHHLKLEAWHRLYYFSHLLCSTWGSHVKHRKSFPLDIVIIYQNHVSLKQRTKLPFNAHHFT